jgi:hypothetical protein
VLRYILLPPVLRSVLRYILRYTLRPMLWFLLRFALRSMLRLLRSTSGDTLLGLPIHGLCALRWASVPILL